MICCITNKDMVTKKGYHICNECYAICNIAH